MLGWLEQSPKLAVEKAFANRGFEVAISEEFHDPGALEDLQIYLKAEELVETTCIVQRALFLYNLAGRNESFNVVNPPENESDFYVSRDDLSNGVYLVPKEYISFIKHMLEIEEGSQVTFGANNDGVIISRRLLNLIEEKTNDSYIIGDKIDFAIAQQALPDFVVSLYGYNLEPLSNLTINAIYDRIPSQTGIGFGLSFYPETQGDGIFVSHNLVNETVLNTLHNGFRNLGKTLYVRVDRNEIALIPSSQATTQIKYLGNRIYQQGRFNVEVSVASTHFLLSFFDQSRLVLLLLLLPFLVLAEVFYLSLVPHLLKSRIEELHYLRLRGTTDQKIIAIQGVEHAFIAIIGVIIGIFGGTIFFDVLLSTTDFITFDDIVLGTGFSLLRKTKSDSLIIGVVGIVSINYSYVMLKLYNIIRGLQRLEGAIPESNRVITSTSVSKNALKLLIFGFGLFLLFTVIGPIVLNEFGAFGIIFQLIPLIAVLLMIMWVFFSFYTPQFFLQVIQSFMESMKVFANPRKKLMWLNLFRRRKQYISLLALLTLTISLLSFSMMYFETLNTNNTQNAEYLNGSDLKIITDVADIQNFTSVVQSIEGVDKCIGLPSTVELQKTQPFRLIQIGKYAITLIGVNPDDYSQLTSHFPQSVVDGPPANRVWYSLNEDPLHAIIISEYFSEVYRYKLGETIPIINLLPGHNAEYNTTIKAVINTAPGIGPLFFGEFTIGSFDYGGYAIVHEDLLKLFKIDKTDTFLLQLNSADQETNVVNQLKSIPTVRMVYTPSAALRFQQDFLQLAGVQGILSLDFLGAIVISIIGIAIFYQYLVNERLSEFALFQAFGATRLKISRIAFIESIFLIALGLSLGLITGSLFTFGILVSTRTVTVNPYNVFLLELTVSPILLISSLTIVTVIIIFSAIIPLRKIYGLEITEVLRGE